MQEFVVYVLYSEKFQKIYVGISSDLINRFHSHNKFATKGFTLKFRPWVIAFVEFYQTKQEALKREKQLKSAQGRKYIHEKIIPFT